MPVEFRPRQARGGGRIGLIITLVLASWAWALPGATPPGGHPTSHWEPQIRAFEAADATNPPPQGAVLFVGSSTIRMWKSLEKDFAFVPVINRGFGGSQLIDSARLAERIIIPYKPRLVCVYAGENDLASGKSPAQVAADFGALVTNVLDRLPQTQVSFIAIKPSFARRHLLDKVRKANELIHEYARLKWRVHFVDLFTPMLDETGEPRADLLDRDGLHLNRQGYELLASILTPHIKRGLTPGFRRFPRPPDSPPPPPRRNP